VKTVDAVVNQDPHESSKSETLAIDNGYRAKYAMFAYDFWHYANARWGILIGNNWMEVVNGPVFLYVNMAGEVGSVPFAYDAYQVETMAATVEIFCERTERAFAAWQLKVHAAITQAYQAKMQAYTDALAQARAAAGTVIAGHNPDFNQKLVANELRRQCLTLVTGQQFDAFGALELSTDGYAQPNLDRTTAQMPYVRFFEQAFEWEHIVYFFYPYFWGWKQGWKNRMSLDDADPPFGEFLRRSRARGLPRAPGLRGRDRALPGDRRDLERGPAARYFELPLRSHHQGNPGGDRRPGNEQPVGDPWEVRLPTTLVRIRPNDDTPAWQKVGEVWQPTNLVDSDRREPTVRCFLQAPTTTRSVSMRWRIPRSSRTRPTSSPKLSSRSCK
jgi:hypothetical protein